MERSGLNRKKIVVVSLHKTGTTSFSQLMKSAGLLVTGPDGNLYTDLRCGDLTGIDAALARFDVFQDDPWYDLYAYIDKKYPNSQFVYLERDTDEWLGSVQRFYGRDRYNNKIRNDLYGSADPIGNPDLYLKKYNDHRETVFDFFKGRNNFLVIDIKKKEDLKRLTDFLEIGFVREDFPHKNKSELTVRQKHLKSLKFMFYGLFGFKKWVKSVLKKLLGYSNYVRIRSEIRYHRARVNRLFAKLKN